MTNTIQVSHNMELAHRLSLLPGKCQNIHGHSMQVHLRIQGLQLNENGIAGGIDFSTLKKSFRAHIDNHYDHRLHLNVNDPWAKPLWHWMESGDGNLIPGLITHDGDPTVENLAKELCEWMANQVSLMLQATEEFDAEVTIEETKTNGASWKMSVGRAHEGF